MSDGIAALRTGSDQLAGSGVSLVQGCEALTEGLQALQKGMISFDEEGIQKIADLAGDDLQNVLAQIRALKEADGAYQSFSGVKDGQKKSFKIEADNQTPFFWTVTPPVFFPRKENGGCGTAARTPHDPAPFGRDI